MGIMAGELGYPEPTQAASRQGPALSLPEDRELELHARQREPKPIPGDLALRFRKTRGLLAVDGGLLRRLDADRAGEILSEALEQMKFMPIRNF
jgi:hypothetical protein